MLDVQNLSYAVGRKTILDRVDFRITEPKLTAIVGSNGAGKSTLIKLISKQYKPTTGQVFWKGADIAETSAQVMAKERAVLTQQVQMNVSFPVREVVLMGRYPHFDSNPSGKDWRAVEEAMNECGIAALADRKYHSLSGGEQQRVHIARAMVQLKYIQRKPALMLLDEPLNNLDVRHQHQCLDLIKAFTAAGNMTMMVIHDINLTARYADQVLLMKGGKLLAFGETKAVLTKANLEEAYEFPVSVEPHPHYDCPVVYFGQPESEILDKSERNELITI